MAAVGNIVVFDGAATPVSHTLVPISVERIGGKLTVTWREKLASLPDEAQVFAMLTVEKTKAGTVVSTFDVRVPVMESVTGANASGYTAAPKVAFTDRNTWVSYAHPRSTVTSRRLARMLLTNLSNNVSTTTAAAVAGVVSECVDGLIYPT